MAANLFAVCQRLLSACSGADGQEAVDDAALHEADDEARDLLVALGYLEADAADGPPRATAPDPAVARNRLALLGLAARLERVFTLPNRQAPRAFFVGGEVAPARFGLPAGEPPLAGVGGKGANLRAAFEGCIGEAAEYLSLHDWGDTPAFSARPDELFPPSDDGHELLSWMLAGIGRADSVADGAIDWLTARALEGDGELPVPFDLCLRRKPGGTAPAPRRAESNGCSAGATRAAAQYRALMELVERDAVALWWYGGQPARALLLDPAGELAAWVAALREGASRRHWFLELGGDLGIPVVAALSCDPEGGTVIGGYAADLDPAQALQGALLEMCQMELALDLVALKIEQRGEAALNEVDRFHLERRRRLRRDAYPRLNPDPGSGKPLEARRVADPRRLALALDALRSAGFEACEVELTRPEVALPVVRVLVPGLQSAKPDWVSARLRRAVRHNGGDEKDWPAMPAVI